MADVENDRFSLAVLFDEDGHGLSHALHNLAESVLGSRRPVTGEFIGIGLVSTGSADTDFHKVSEPAVAEEEIRRQARENWSRLQRQKAEIAKGVRYSNRSRSGNALEWRPCASLNIWVSTPRG